MAGWIGSGNMGDEAILASVVDSLAGFAEVRTLSTDEARTRDLHRIKTAPFELLPHPVRFLRAFREADLVLIGGGGLLQDRSSLLNVPRYIYKVFVARLLGRPVGLYAVSVGSITHGFSRWLIRIGLKRSSFVTVRDRASRDRLVEYGVTPSLIEVSADPATTLEPSSGEDLTELVQTIRSHAAPVIGVSLRHPAEVSRFVPVRLARRFRRRRPQNDPRYADLVRNVAAALDIVHEQCGGRFVFVPMWFERDSQVHADVIAVMRHRDAAAMLQREYHPREVRALVGCMDLMISMRLHGLIFATSAGTPWVGLDYAAKVADYGDQIGGGDQLIPIDQVKADALAILVLNTIAGRTEISARLLTRAREQASADLARNVGAIERTLAAGN